MKILLLRGYLWEVYGAVKLGACYPERFAAVASLSGSVDMIHVIEKSKNQSDKAKMYRNLTFGTLEEMRGSEMDTVFMLEKRLKEGTPSSEVLYMLR